MEKQQEEDICQVMEFERQAAIETALCDKIAKSQERGKTTAINQQQIIYKEEMKKESY